MWHNSGIWNFWRSNKTSVRSFLGSTHYLSVSIQNHTKPMLIKPRNYWNSIKDEKILLDLKIPNTISEDAFWHARGLIMISSHQINLKSNNPNISPSPMNNDFNIAIVEFRWNKIWAYHSLLDLSLQIVASLVCAWVFPNWKLSLINPFPAI